jgi:hypothetical protein
MTRSSQTIRNAAVALLLVFLSQACVQFKVDAPAATPTARDIETPTAELPTAAAAIETVIPTQTAVPTFTPAPLVAIHVVKGNLFIRRGPDMAFNPIGVLYKDTSAPAIGRDILSKWVQVEIPGTDKTGWVSIQTSYSQIDGNVESLPEVKPTEWPTPAYLRNCTHHEMYVPEADMIIPSSYKYPDNEVWIYPGSYTVLDLEISGEPEVMNFTISEGQSVEIREDASGERRKCP